jgi:hypothetical protein
MSVLLSWLSVLLTVFLESEDEEPISLGQVVRVVSASPARAASVAASADRAVAVTLWPRSVRTAATRSPR